ncbi:MAG TPA: hypothetical protein VNM40_03645 [Candidatus Paceibacterota bacterium]|nr:hypothetical protein [Candidatus Paceibacterota bacterium]
MPIPKALQDLRDALKGVETISKKIRAKTEVSATKLLILGFLRRNPSKKRDEIAKGTGLHYSIVKTRTTIMVNQRELKQEDGRYSATMRGRKTLTEALKRLK